jgi:hypothetical protein
MGVAGAFGDYGVADTMIFLGEDYATPQQGFAPQVGYKIGSSGMVSVDQAQNEIWRMDAAQINRLDDLIEASTGKRPDDFETRKYWWNKWIDYAGAYSSATNETRSPWDMGAMSAAQSRPGGGAGGGPTTTFATTEQINLTNPSTARQVLDGALGQYLGRMPTNKEYNVFLKALNATEEASPSITEQVSRTVPGQGTSRVSSKVRSEGGMSREQFATEFAKGQEDYAETQLSTTGLGAFLELLG